MTAATARPQRSHRALPSAQYGLGALDAGAITPEQFLDLNEKIGGYDQDGNYAPGRSRADADALRRAYWSGIELSDAGGLASLPMFDFGGYDEIDKCHYQWFRFAVRERLIAANGGAANHVMWRVPSMSPQVPEDAIAKMDRWMIACRADRGGGTPYDRVVRAKPADLVDSCADKDSAGNRIAERQVFGRAPTTPCNRMWLSFADPRQIAGGPLSAAVLKCQLKPIAAGDYRARFTPSQMARLKRIFPGGLCDWGKGGVGQTKVRPWGSFVPSPVSRIDGKS